MLPAKSRVELAFQEACIQHWLSRYLPRIQRTYKSSLAEFLRWLWRMQEEPHNPDLPETLRTVRMPSELLAFQEKAEGRAEYAVLDLMLDHVQEKGGTYSSMLVRLSNLRSFFLKNRVEIPVAKDWQPHPTKEPTRGQLTVEKVREIIQKANLRDQAIFLTMFQGLMDLERFTQFNLKYAGQLASHLQSKSLDEPFRIDYLKGRKRNKNPFNTFVYRDALQAWELYFNRVRGWPKQGEPIALQRLNQAITKDAIYQAFNTVARQLRLKPARSKDMTTRTGVAPHEAFRDVVKTMLRTKAKAEGFDLDVGDYFMGHTVDPLQYDKFAELEPDYVVKHAKIAAKHLNIISNQVAEKPEVELELKVLKDKMSIVEKLLQDKMQAKA